MIPFERFWLRLRRSLASSLGVDLTHSQNRYFETLQATLPAGGRWIDLGCGHQIVPDWAGPEAAQKALAQQAELLVGADLDSAIRNHPSLEHRVFASATHLPFRDAVFDFVTANMVVEHLEAPAAVFEEALRTLRPGGVLLFHTPNLGYYGIFIASLIPDWLKRRIIRLLERREDEDIFHTYYRANTAEEARQLLTAAGFGSIRVVKTRSTGMLQFLGPLGVLEILWLKLLNWADVNLGRSTLIVTASKPKR